MSLASLLEWKARNREARIANARKSAQELADALPRSSLGIARQSHAQTMGFVANHRAKAIGAASIEVRKARLTWARNWLASAREERIARNA